MSTVDKKLMDQMFRLTKNTIASVSEKNDRILEGARVSEVEEVTRTVVERGLRSLPLEQRVLLESERDRRTLELGRSQVLRLLGTWGMMSVEAVQDEFPRTDVPALLDTLEHEGLVTCFVDASLGSEQRVVALTDEGKCQFAAREDVWNERAGMLFSQLNEYEKMQLYLLLRKMQGTPAYEEPAPLPASA